jgi:hypothetical protein
LNRSVRESEIERKKEREKEEEGEWERFDSERGFVAVIRPIVESDKGQWFDKS